MKDAVLTELHCSAGAPLSLADHSLEGICPCWPDIHALPDRVVVVHFPYAHEEENGEENRDEEETPVEPFDWP